MPNLVKISYQINKFFIKELKFDQSVDTAVICYIYEKFFGGKRICAEFKINISKNESRIY